MKIMWYLLCLIIGHNKILQKWTNEENMSFYDLCTQCQKTWHLHQVQKKSIVKEQPKKIENKEIVVQAKPIKKAANFYVL